MDRELQWSSALDEQRGHGPMVLIGGSGAEGIRDRLRADRDHAAPHIIDAEVFGVIRRQHLHGHLDRTEATQAVEDLEAWPRRAFRTPAAPGPGVGFATHLAGWDAMYVALAEALDAVLVTTDGRLASAAGPSCPIEVIGHR